MSSGISGQAAPLHIRNVRPVGLPGIAGGATDVLIAADGRIAAVAPGLPAPEGARVLDGGGAWLSPGWIDLHTHVWHGGTDISVRTSQCGVARGVTTLVDAGSAGEANFHGFREYVIERAPERVKAFLNLGSIGLVACNRVSELRDIGSIDIDRTVACVRENREHIIGLKVRASHVITGSWGIEPVKIARKLARILKLPVMVHVGEPPATYDEVLEVLAPGDIVTHCFNGKVGSSLMEDEQLFALAQSCAARGVRLDIGHGGASFSFRVAEAAIKRGLMPFSISTDVHLRSMDQSVWDLSTTMSKLLAAGMGFEAVVAAVTHAPAAVVGLDYADMAAGRSRAELTLFDLVPARLEVVDSLGDRTTLERLFEPRHAVIGTDVFASSRYRPERVEAVDHSHGYSYR